MDLKLTCAIFVTYHPGGDVPANIARVTKQGVPVVVVDNSPGAAPPLELGNLEGPEILRNGRNLGIAAALNIGIRAAISEGYEWVLLFDQDSQVCDGFVEAMLRASVEGNSVGNVGLVAPHHRDARLGITLPTHRNKAGEIVDCMTSGSMLNAKTFAALGPMEERLFIDSVDHEYCLRMRAAGWKIVEAPDAWLLHSLGRITFHRFFGRKVMTTNHSPERRYYIHRNRLALIWRYRAKDIEWAFGEFKGGIVDTIKVLLFEEQKGAKAKYMALGFYHALRGVFGPRVEL